MMVRHYLLNDDGKTYREIDLFSGDVMTNALAIAGQLADDERRNVGDDTIDGYRISTKFIGIDTTPAFLGPDAPPTPFECMAFGPEGEEVLARFTSWDDAKRFHGHVVALLRSIAKEGIKLTPAYIDLARGSALHRVRGND